MFFCPNCSFKSCSKSALENHFKNNHPGHKHPPIWKTIEQTTKNVHEGSKEIEVPLELSSGNNTNKKFTCSGCNSVFKSETELKVHEERSKTSNASCNYLPPVNDVNFKDDDFLFCDVISCRYPL